MSKKGIEDTVRTMPPSDGILETALYVDDPARSGLFYRMIFGFEVIDSGPRLTAMRIAPRQVLLLCKKGASAQIPLTPHDGSGHLHVAYAIPAAALADWEAWLAHHNVTILERKTWDRGGVSLYFHDPDGHVIEVATPGVWTVY